jgi:type IV pilus assembly protein PilC
MPTFVASVRDATGAIKRERVKADSSSDARTSLRERGFFVQDIKQAQGFDLQKLSEINIDEYLASVTVKDKAIFSRQLSTMISAGVPIVRSLGILAAQTSNAKFKKAITHLSNDVQQGTNLSEAMEKHPACFDKLYVSMVQAGEIGGVLDDVMNRLSKLLEDVARLQNQIRSALTYPAVVTFLAVGIFMGMCIFLIPIFEGIFDSLGAQLPGLTQLMVSISKFLRNPLYIGAAIVFIVAGSLGYQYYYRTRVGRETIDRLSLKVPLFGDLIMKTAVARFSRTFGALTRSGVPILTALDIVRDTSGNQVIANAIDDAKREIQSGGMISLALQKERVFPPMAVQMISIGEETGELDHMLMKVADFYEDEVEQAVKALTSLLEPIMIVVLGGMVGTILISMYLPLFSIFDQLA